MPQPWMLFQMTNPNNSVHAPMDVYYLWNGSFAIVVFDGEGLSIEQSGWTGKTAEDLSEQEIRFMNGMAQDKRKRIFKLPRNGRHYRVVQRGVFDAE